MHFCALSHDFPPNANNIPSNDQSEFGQSKIGAAPNNERLVFDRRPKSGSQYAGKGQICEVHLHIVSKFQVEFDGQDECRKIQLRELQFQTYPSLQCFAHPKQATTPRYSKFVARSVRIRSNQACSDIRLFSFKELLLHQRGHFRLWPSDDTSSQLLLSNLHEYTLHTRFNELQRFFEKAFSILHLLL